MCEVICKYLAFLVRDLSIHACGCVCLCVCVSWNQVPRIAGMIVFYPSSWCFTAANWFLNNEVSIWMPLRVCHPCLLCLPSVPALRSSESVSSCCRNNDFDWVSALLPPHLGRLFSFGRNLSERIDFLNLTSNAIKTTLLGARWRNWHVQDPYLENKEIWS